MMSGDGSFQELMGLTRQFPNLKVLDRIGSGGVCAVFDVLDMTHDRRVALKIMHQKIVDDALILKREPEMMQRFHLECRLGVELPKRNVPRIPSVYTDFKLGERPGVLMQLIQGRPLNTLAPVRDADAAVAMLCQTAETLMRLHEEGVIHGDLTPENTILDKDGVVWVLDLGIARTVGEHWPEIIHDERPVHGKPAYTAPEVLTDNAMMNRASDMYTMGMFMVVLMTGRLHPPVETERDGDAADVPEFQAMLPELRSVCLDCLSSNPDDRPLSRDVYQVLRSLWDQRHPAASPETYLTEWQLHDNRRGTVLFPEKPGVTVNIDMPDTVTPPDSKVTQDTAAIPAGSESSVDTVPPAGVDPTNQAADDVTGRSDDEASKRWVWVGAGIVVLVLVVAVLWVWIVPDFGAERAALPGGGMSLGTDAPDAMDTTDTADAANTTNTADAANTTNTADAAEATDAINATDSETPLEPLSSRVLTLAESGDYDGALRILKTEGFTEDEYLVRLVMAAREHNR